MNEHSNNAPASSTATADRSTDTSNHATLSEAEFLQQQADEAKAAILRAVEQARQLLGSKVDPRELTRAHPFIAVGSVVLAGFVTALVAIPSREQQELRRLQKVQEALRPKPAESLRPESNGSAAKPPASIWSTLAKEAVTMLKPILMALISSQMNKPQPEPTADGPTQAQPAN